MSRFCEIQFQNPGPAIILVARNIRAATHFPEHIMPVLSNARHERMAQLIAAGHTDVDAHEKAGYKRDEGNAGKLARREDITSRVLEITSKAAERVEINKAWVLAKLVQNVERAMQHEAVLDDEGKPVGEYQYQGNVANRALELIGREFNMFVERREHGLPGEFAALQDDELHETLRGAAAELGIEIEEGATAH